MTRLNHKQNQLSLYLGVFLAFLSASAVAADWAWQLESATIFDSTIAIQHADGSVSRHHFQCDLTDALNEKTEISSSIETIVPISHPEGVLVVTCYKGAHTEMIAIVDPLEDKIVYKKIGSYFVDWHLEDGKIIIDYDMPCVEPEITEKKSIDGKGGNIKEATTTAQTCADPNNAFVTVSQSWP